MKQYYNFSKDDTMRRLPVYVNSYGENYEQDRYFGYRDGATINQLIYVLKGTLVVESRGERLEVPTGSFLLFRLHTPLKLRPKDGLLLTDFITALGSGCEPLMDYYRLPPLYRFESTAVRQSMHEVIHAIRHGAKETASEKLYSLLFLIGKEYAAGEDPDRVTAAVRFIREHYAQNLSVGDIARACRMSESLVYKTFRSVLKTTPLAYLTGVRLEWAKTSLRDRNLSLAQIARQAGFNSVSYFIQCFKKSEGITPARWRSQLK